MSEEKDTKAENNDLMMLFLEDCKKGKDTNAGYHYRLEPSFKNFIAWLDGRTWEMEVEK